MSLRMEGMPRFLVCPGSSSTETKPAVVCDETLERVDIAHRRPGSPWRDSRMGQRDIAT